MNRLSIYLMCLGTLLSQATLAQTNWTITDEYTIAFSGSRAEGTFTGLEGAILFDEDNLNASRFAVYIDPATISTGNKTKDKHARGDSWLDVKKYVKIGFVSDQIQKTSEGYTAKGLLSMHGTSKEVQIDFTFIQTSENAGLFKGKMKVNREDYGIDGPLFSFVVGEEFEIDISVNVKK
ncbi:MAG: YceI family protein [Bacteroidota bacterium]